MVAVFLRGRYRARVTETKMAWSAKSNEVLFGVKADAVEVAGVVEVMGSPSVWRVLVFSNDGYAGVVKDECPLLGGF